MIGEGLILCLLVTTIMAKEKAILEIVIHRSVGKGEYITQVEKLVGHFSDAGSRVSAEGSIIQLHPLALCNGDDYEEVHEYGWVGVIKLETVEPDPCMSLYQKAEKAIHRGATAVVFDITDHQQAVQELKATSEFGHHLERPVIFVHGSEAVRLMEIVNNQREARARIWSHLPQEEEVSETKEYFDMGIFVSAFIVFCIICVVVILKLKVCHRNRQMADVTDLAKHTINKLKTRKYKFPSAKSPQSLHTPTSDVYSQISGMDTCAICLEEYKEGQVLRVLPCSHEFHKECVDPWLISNRTCPLCLFNIMGYREPLLPNSVSPIETRTDNYDIPVVNSPDSAVNGISDSDSSQMYHQIRESPYRQINFYQDGDVIPHRCPSCEGNRGSSPSSSAGYPWCSGTHYNHHYTRNINNYHHRFYHGNMQHVNKHDPNLMDRNSNLHYSKILPKNMCLANSSLTSSRPVPRGPGFSMFNSGMHASFIPHCVSVPHTSCVGHSCRDTKVCHAPTCCLQATYCHSYPHSCREQRVCESEPESGGSDTRNASITAKYGSCSSDSSGRNPSNTSSLDRGFVGSNQSTFGSSDVKLPSDTTSCDSNVFKDGSDLDDLCPVLSSRSKSLTTHEQLAAELSRKLASYQQIIPNEAPFTNEDSSGDLNSSREIISNAMEAGADNSYMRERNSCDLDPYQNPCSREVISSDLDSGSVNSLLSINCLPCAVNGVLTPRVEPESNCLECSSRTSHLTLSDISGVSVYNSSDNVSLCSETSHFLAKGDLVTPECLCQKLQHDFGEKNLRCNTVIEIKNKSSLICKNVSESSVQHLTNIEQESTKLPYSVSCDQCLGANYRHFPSCDHGHCLNGIRYGQSRLHRRDSWDIVNASNSNSGSVHLSNSNSGSVHLKFPYSYSRDDHNLMQGEEYFRHKENSKRKRYSDEFVQKQMWFCQACQQQRTGTCPSCHRDVTQFRRSMVVFTEPQGEFITVPLSDREDFDPVNAV